MRATFVPYGNEPIQTATPTPTPPQVTTEPAEPETPLRAIRPEDTFDDFGGTGGGKRGW